MLLAIIFFLAALAVALGGGRRGLRALVALAIVLAPLRGGLLEIADNVSLGHPGLTVNALVPALVAAVVIGCVVCKRPRLGDLPRLLLVGWLLIAAAVAVSFFGRTVGLEVYGVGAAQYLVYPTLALAIWPLLEPGDVRWLARLLIGMGVLVAATVVLQAMGVEGFIQAASAQVDGLAANRYAGITGSYLHTSAFLGVVAVLVMGEFATLDGRRPRLVGSVLLALLLSAEVLTFSRSGIVIAAIGLVALFLFAVRGRRTAFAILVVPAIAVAIASGALGGVAPGAAGARVTSGFSPGGDPGNKLREESFQLGLKVFGEGTALQKAAGQGAAATGNGQQLVNDKEPQLIVESYYLKLLVETGVLGLILAGGFLAWAAIVFALAAWRPVDPWSASVAAAGLGLSLYNAIYPALETQILALVWWLLLVVCLKSGEGVEQPVLWRPGRAGAPPAEHDGREEEAVAVG